jgi:hypothetical protein
MLKKTIFGGLVAGAIAVPLAGAAWAQPNEPTPPTVPGSNGQGLACAFQNSDTLQGPPGTMWREVAQITDPSVVQALDPQLGGPTPGQPVKLFCQPAGAAAAPGQQIALGPQTAPGQQLPPEQQPGSMNP